MTTDEELVGLYTLITDALSDGPPSWKRDPVDNGKLEFTFESCGTNPKRFSNISRRKRAMSRK